MSTSSPTPPQYISDYALTYFIVTYSDMCISDLPYTQKVFISTNFRHFCNLSSQFYE